MRKIITIFLIIIVGFLAGCWSDNEICTSCNNYSKWGVDGIESLLGIYSLKGDLYTSGDWSSHVYDISNDVDLQTDFINDLLYIAKEFGKKIKIIYPDEIKEYKKIIGSKCYDIIIIGTKEVQKVLVKENGKDKKYCYKNYCPLPNKCNITAVVKKIRKNLIEKALNVSTTGSNVCITGNTIGSKNWK